MGLVSDYGPPIEGENWGRFTTHPDGSVSFDGWRSDQNKENFCSARSAVRWTDQTMVIDSPSMGVTEFADQTIITYIHISVLKDYLKGEETTS